MGSTTLLAAFLLSAFMLEETLPPELQVGRGGLRGGTATGSAEGHRCHHFCVLPDQFCPPDRLRVCAIRCIQEKGLWVKLRRWRQGRQEAKQQDEQERRRLTAAEEGEGYGNTCSSSSSGGIEGGADGKGERRRRRRRQSRLCREAGTAATQGAEAGAGVAGSRDMESAGAGEEAGLLLSKGACRSDDASAAAGATAAGFPCSSSGSETDSSSLVDIDLHESDVESRGGGRAGGARPGEAGAPPALQPCPSTSGSTNRMRYLLRLTSRTFISGNPFSRAGSWRRAGSGCRRSGGGGVLGSDAEEAAAASETEPWRRSPAASPRAGVPAGGTVAGAGGYVAGSPLHGGVGAEGGTGRGGGGGAVRTAEAETEAVPLLLAAAAAEAVGGVATAAAPAPSRAALELVTGRPELVAGGQGQGSGHGHSHSDSSGSTRGAEGVLSPAPGSASDCGSGSGSGSGEDAPPPSGTVGTVGTARRGVQDPEAAALTGEARGLDSSQQLKPAAGGNSGMDADRALASGGKGGVASGDEQPCSGPHTPLATLHEDSSHHGGSRGLAAASGAPEHKHATQQHHEQHQEHHLEQHQEQHQKLERRNHEQHEEGQEQPLEFVCVLKRVDSAQQRAIELELATIDAAADTAAPAPASAPSWYKDREVVLTILGYGATALLFCAVDEVFPIYAAAPLSSGERAPHSEGGGIVRQHRPCWPNACMPLLLAWPCV